MLPLQSAVELILQLLRDSYPAKDTLIINGSYQQDLRNKMFQLVRLWLPRDSQTIPEISANKYGLWIRLLHRDTQIKTPQIEHDVSIKLAMCML